MKNGFNLSQLDNMMLNIIEEGKNNIWQSIEEEKDAIIRVSKRQFFNLALNRLEKNNCTDLDKL